MPRLSPAGIRLLVSDVDGTLVTHDKRLTPRVQDAARAVEQAGIAFTITSSRPAFGMRMLIAPLAIKAPVAAFNGGLFVSPERLERIEGNPVPVEIARHSIGVLAGKGVGIWIHTEKAWFALDAAGDYVDHEIHDPDPADHPDKLRSAGRDRRSLQDRRRQQELRPPGAMRARACRRAWGERDGCPLAALLSRCDAPARQQGARGAQALGAGRHSARSNRRHPGWPERHRGVC